MSLGFMRRHRRWLYVFLWIVILAFVVLYIPDFKSDRAGSPAETLATVGEATITAGEFQRAYLDENRRLRDLYQGRLDENQLRSLRIEEQVFERLVAQRLLDLEAERLGVRVDDETLKAELATSAQFQRDGHFIGGAEIKRVLKLRGMTPEQFESDLREGLVRQRVQQLVTAGVSVADTEVEREYRQRNEKVKLEYVQVELQPFKTKVDVSDADIAQRFKDRSDDYRLPEKRVLSYLLVDPEALRAQVSVTEAEIRAHHEANLEQFTEPEQACASHVLIKTKASPEASEGHSEEEGRRLAEVVLQKARSGADFAELAKQSSEDLGSATRGGDLGCFGRGQMVPAFDDAVFALEAGQISELIKTNFGFHVIRLQAMKKPITPALSAVKERIQLQLQNQRVQSLAAEKVQAIQELLGRGKDLAQAAREHGFVVQKSAPFERGKAPAPIEAPAVAARAFALKPGETDRTGQGLQRSYVFFALAEVQPSRTAKLEEVQDRVKSDLTEERAEAAARTAALELRAQAETRGLDQAALATGRSRKETQGPVQRGQPYGDLGSSAALDEAAFSLEPQQLSAPVRSPGGYALLRVTEKTPADPSGLESQKANLLASLRDERKRQLFQAYLAQLRERYAVERRPDVFRRLIG